jgi:hypothetical protein
MGEIPNGAPPDEPTQAIDNGSSTVDALVPSFTNARLLPRIPAMGVDQEGRVESLRDVLPAHEFKIRIGTNLACVVEDLRDVLAIVDDH